jgi:hypothetical protein
MPGLVPGIYALLSLETKDVAKQKTWMAGTSPAMTRDEHLRIFASAGSMSPD